MTCSSYLGCVVLALGVIFPKTALSQTNPTPEELVRQLGDRSFQVREQATKRLIALGRASVPALEAGSRGVDSETVRRCELILRKARRTDGEILLDDFAADLEGKKNLKPAGWERFRKLAGDGSTSRLFFVEAYRKAGVIWELLETDKAAAIVKFSEQCEAIRKRRNAPFAEQISFSFSEILAAFLLASDARLNPSQNQVASAFGTFAYDTRTAEWSSQVIGKLLKSLLDETKDPQLAMSLIPIGQTFNAPGFEDVALKPTIVRLIPLLGPNPGQQLLQFFLVFGYKLNLKEIRPVAQMTLQNKKSEPKYHILSMQIMVKLGADDAIPILEELLTDRRELSKLRPGGALRGDWITHKVSDTALAALLLLTRQKLTDYDFPYPNIFPEVPIIIGSGADGFYDDNSREAAIKKWREWRAKNPGKKAG